MSEQDQIAKFLLQTDATIDAASNELGGLRSLKKGLMSDLLTGRIRVPLETAS
ncbi:hypothetical protein G9444_6291 [Rhodococcus erythropolis]|uniref:Restriction endonuclease subunit S n=2 Tax=Nocardiaceae TaxID=85025 RepID=A0A6G9D306_RHOER|nr:hypothetical protein G9444_6291 [Rhodococcus erythropolis]